MSRYDLQRQGTKVPYSLDFTEFLAASSSSPSDTISSASWSITPTSDDSPTEPTLSSAQVDGAVATVFVENPRFGEIYQLQCEVLTSQGLRDRQTITIRCQ